MTMNMRMNVNCFAVVLALILGSFSCYAEQTRVACLGDSITNGGRHMQREGRSYPTLLGKILGDDFKVGNFGKSGIPLARYDTTREYKNALALKPDLVVIMLGTNDAHKKNWKSRDFFKEKLTSLMADFRKANPAVKFYLCVPLPIFHSKWGHDGKLLAGQIVPVVKEVAKKEKCKIIDLYTFFLDKEAMMKDGVHPKPEGYRIMAEKIASVLKGGKPTSRPESAPASAPAPEAKTPRK